MAAFWGALGRDILNIALSRFSDGTASKIYNMKTIGKQFATGQSFSAFLDRETFLVSAQTTDFLLPHNHEHTHIHARTKIGKVPSV